MLHILYIKHITTFMPKQAIGHLNLKAMGEFKELFEDLQESIHNFRIELLSSFFFQVLNGFVF